MKKISLFILALGMSVWTCVYAQQLPNSDFEDWSASTFDGEVQPKDWNFSNVTQFGLKFNFAHRDAGHTGSYCMMCQDQEIGAAGITETSPGYVSLGTPWVYIESLTKVSQATAGDAGGISWTYRPDTMAVWIKRTGNNTHRENFNILFYSWKGTARSSSYKGKNGNCTSTTRTDEESDIRLSTDGNECGTSVKAQQIAEGWYKEMKTYSEWTLLKIPICYMSNDVPEKCNVIFSASNYPNFRANSGLYAGNSLYIDDVQLIYSSKIEKLYIGDVAWNGFNPNTEEEQVYSLGESATEVPDIYATRGSGSFTNSKGATATFVGRRLQSSEIEIKKGKVGEVTTITVHAEDGSSTTTYRIRFAQATSSNTLLSGLWMKTTEGDSLTVASFNPYTASCEVELPYGTTAPPVISAIKAESDQRVDITQAASLSDPTIVRVTAADGIHTRTYTITFRVALLADNSLQDILVNGVSVAGFTPSQTIYRVSVPLGTTVIPTVKAVSAYPDGEQTIVYKAPETVDGGVYQITVTTPGNATPRTYKLTFRVEASTYSKLKDIQVGDGLLEGFDPDVLTYYVSLPMGTTKLPDIRYEQGDPYQTVTLKEGDLNGVTFLTVKAASGAQSVYRIIFTTPQSSESRLQMIYVDGVEVDGFSPEQRVYNLSLPQGTTALPPITWQTMDEYQTVTVTDGGVNGTTRITSVAGDGTTTVYQLFFTVSLATDCTLRMIYLDGQALDGFMPEKTDYSVILPRATQTLPEVTYDLSDPSQRVTVRKPAGLTGDYRLVVRAENGATQTYTIAFQTLLSTNTTLQTIRLDGVNLAEFDAETTEYTILLPSAKLPEVEPVKGDASQKILSVREGLRHTITVTAENGDQRVYTLVFSIQKSQSALLKMIYINGDSLEGFQPEQLTYSYTIQGVVCPSVTVDKEEGQQVVITTPYAAGEGQIRVQSESGEWNLYILTFLAAPTGSVQLADILLDGVSMDDFDPTQLHYERTVTTALPTVQPVCQTGQQAEVLWQDSVATVYVTSGEQLAQYEIVFSRRLSSDCALKAILADGVVIKDFAPAVNDYTLHLPAGSELPVMTYVLSNDGQTVWMGQEQRHVCQLIVQAADGVTQCTYTVNFDIDLYDDANLVNLQVEGFELPFIPTQSEYTLTLESGVTLPALTLTTKPGQTTLVTESTANEQQILVRAESGRTRTYTLYYKRQLSQNALLQDILIDGVSLQGFDPHTFTYTDSLASDATVTPAVHPVGQTTDQTITTYHAAVGGITRVHVVSADGTQEADYQITFPLRKSHQTTLKSVEIDEALDFVFVPEQTDYLVTLPQGTTAAPTLYYTGSAAQRVDYVAAPLSGISSLHVFSPDGDERLYTFRFQVADSEAANRLKTLTVNGQSLNVAMEQQTVTLPYATTSFDIDYTKSFEEQTVIVLNGGVYQPTTIRLRSNRDGEEDFVYTLTPVLVPHDPAVLADIQVNGVSVDNFDPMVYNYVVNVTAKPTITAVAADGATVVTSQALNEKTKSIKFRVTSGEYSNEYTVSYYYTNCEPPFDFTSDWVKAAKGNGYKPTSAWKVPADYSSGYTWTIPLVSIPLTYSTGKEVTQSGNGVLLATQRGASMNGSVPGMMTLGAMTLNLTSNGNSSSSVTKSATAGVTFRNTPEQFAVRVKPLSTTNISNWKIWLTMSDGSSFVETPYTGNFSALNTWQDVMMNINYPSGAVSRFNILLNSGDQENAGSYGGSTVYASDVQMENLRFIYNSRLASATVDGQNATITGTNITYTFSDPEYAKFPELRVVGQVHDQMQQLTWNDEVNGTRTALLRNFGEDGSYTDYNVTITRPLSASNTLQTLLVNGVPLTGFDANTTAYTYPIACGATVMPDVTAVPAGTHATVAMKQTDHEIRIQVTAETGETREYVITFAEQRSNDTRLAMLTADGVTFNADTREYHLQSTTLPAISFTKRSDGQTVTLSQGVITVVAEDGVTTDFYRLLLDYVTTGQFSQWQLDGAQPTLFRPDTYDYSLPRPDYTSFLRTSDQDSVIFLQTAEKMQWLVYGYQSTQQPKLLHTYTLTYPTEASANADLQDIQIDGIGIDGFQPGDYTYTVYTDTAVQLSVVKSEQQQQVSIDLNETTYTITVTAQNGTQQTYTLSVQPVVSADVTLRGIAVDGVSIEGFDPAVLQYHITLPVPAVKTEEPALPDLTYTVAHPRQKVEIQTGQLGVETYLIVTAEDGIHSAIYEVLVDAEPSHNASLTAILVDGRPVERFEQGRHYYSAKASSNDAVLSWAADDRFQTYQLEVKGQEYTVIVTAQDGKTQEKYVIDMYFEALPNDATLQQIYLNDTVALAEFEPELNPRLSFDANNNRYLIYLPAGTQTLPSVSAQLKADGQNIEIRSGNLTDSLIVTAQDGVTTNTYILEFVIPLSSNANLAMIYLNSDSLQGFKPDQYFYTVTLPIGEHAIPNVFVQKDESAQTIDPIQQQGQQVTITSHAEDGTTVTYILLFTYTPSDENQLAMIYADNDSLPNFQSSEYNYYISLPIGTRTFPTLTYDSVDQWQRIETREVYRTDDQLTMQIEVQAESGTKNIYSVAFTIDKSSVDTLRMIYVDNQPLPLFQAAVTEYSDTLPTGTDRLPKIEWEPGDPYQIITIDTLVDVLLNTKSLGQKVHIEVQAEDHSRRTYILHFPVALSDNTELAMIWNNGNPLTGFNKQLYEYDINIPFDESGKRLMPAITVTKTEEEQKVDIYPQGDSLLLIRVLAEDAVHEETYQVRFHYGMSPETSLADIRINGNSVPAFTAEVTEYNLLAFVTDTLPLVEWIPSVSGQQLHIEGPNVQYDSEGIRSAYYSCDVTAPDEEHFRSYTLAIVFSQTSADTMQLSSRLTSIAVRGISVSRNAGFDIDFLSDSLTYRYRTYPVATRNDALFDLDDVTFVTEDPEAKVFTQVSNREMLTDTFAIEPDGTVIYRHVERRIDIVVSNRKGLNPTQYSLYQQVELSRDSTIDRICFNGVPYLDYDPDEHTYTYEIKAGTAPPLVTFYAADSLAYTADVVSDEYMTEDSTMVWTRTLICQSEYAYAYDRQNVARRNIYVIRFVQSAINEADSPWEGDLLVKHLPYTNQVAFASLRSGVQISLYDANGQMLFFHMLQAASPSNVIVSTDSYGRALFTDVTDISQCMVTTLQPGKIYYYCFYEAAKKRVKRGKLLIVN